MPGALHCGGLIAGALARVYGVDNAFLIGGIAALALIAVLSAAAPRYRRLEA